MYNIGARKNLANTFGLFQLGHKVLISGNIVGYAQEEYMWIISVSRDPFSLPPFAMVIQLIQLLPGNFCLSDRRPPDWSQSTTTNNAKSAAL
jgi:hypothetical protein